VYNLISACAVCQNAQPGPWLGWNASCAAYPVPPGKWPLPIPPGTSIPAWAFINPASMDGTFNFSIALANLNAPESAAPTTSFPSTSKTSTSTTTSSPTPAPANTPPPADSNHVGAIVGGVVGGLLGLGILLLALAFWYRRRSRRSSQGASQQPQSGSGYKESIGMGSLQSRGQQTQARVDPRLGLPPEFGSRPTSVVNPRPFSANAESYFAGSPGYQPPEIPYQPPEWARQPEGPSSVLGLYDTPAEPAPTQVMPVRAFSESPQPMHDDLPDPRAL